MDKKGIATFFLTDSLRIFVGGVMLFWPAGRIDWWPAWALLAVIVATEAVIGYIGIRIHPTLLGERVGARMGDKLWDVAIYLGLRLGEGAIFVIAGLDQRFGWTAGFPVGIQIAGFAACILGYGLFVWAMASNMFFSAVMRIQTGRGHTVATGGPYRFVRHPGYIAGIVFELGMPILLASWWALILGVLCAILFGLRTALEDRTLLVELPGYAEYARQVRYRLLPGIW
jgi:protein-S-isoprenylcysteine O-methyltransferase Ste14